MTQYLFKVYPLEQTAHRPQSVTEKKTNTIFSHLQPASTGIRGLMRGMATLLQGNQELLVVKYKVGRPPGELGVSKSMECDIFPFSALRL